MTQMYWLHTLSPTHVGCGRGLGYIDLPIQRDKLTKWPIIPGSTFKGVWADHFGATLDKRERDLELRLAFGRASDNDPEASNAGALMPTDARIVCLPVRSFYGTFAWCSSPLALQWLQRDLEKAGLSGVAKPFDFSGDSCVLLPKESLLASPPLKDAAQGKVFFEDLDFNAQISDAAMAWAEKLGDWVFPLKETQASWREIFRKRFAIVPDAVFDFLCETGTEVSTRVRIQDDSKTVAAGQLWNEEALPVETILAGLICRDRVYTQDETYKNGNFLDRFTKGELALQIGGKASVGRGRVRCVFSPPAVKGN